MDRLFSHETHCLDNFEFNFNPGYHGSLFPEQQYQEVSPDGSSSPSSFICLSKQTNEGANSSDYEGSDKLNENDSEDQNKLPKIIKRAIYKRYDPITDNGITYNHQDDPVEYKKARKRVQNRISATKIRSKNKNCVEDLKVELDDLKAEIVQLKSANNVLTSENTLLKQQITFMERLLMGGAGKPVETPVSQPYSQDIKLDVSTKTEIPTYSRKSGSGSLRKHTAYLGIMTLLLCISGVLAQGALLKTSSPLSLLSNGKTNLVASFDHNKLSTIGELNIAANRANGVANSSTIFDRNSPTSLIILAVETLFIAVYVLYAIYVFSIAHRKYIHRSDNPQ